MAGFDIASGHQWRPFESLGLTHSFFALQADTLIYSWVALGLLIILAVIARMSVVAYPTSMLAYITKSYIRMFIGMVKEACGAAETRYVTFFTVLFTWLLICNCLIIIPTCEEPTKDINTTLALSLLVFFYIQYEAARRHGLLVHLNEFFKTPLPVRGVYDRWTLWSVVGCAVRVTINTVIGLLWLPMELLGKCSNIISLSFRLFGNIFAGSVISSIWLHARSGSLLWQLIGLISGFNLIIILFFGIFEGCVQAFVFTMLSLSYLSRALQEHE